MEELLDMGFPPDLATHALAATGGGSAAQAADWILSQKPASVATTSPSAHHHHQPKLNHFFPSPKLTTTTSAAIGDDASAVPTPRKRPRVHPPLTPSRPLSERMRPRTIDDVVGQDHLLAGPASLIRSSLSLRRLPSLLLWGPPGSGKTSIARALAASLPPASHRFVPLSAVSAGVKDVRDVFEEAKRARKPGLASATTILFVDEVHRFNKAQQDSFLPAIEDGTIVFVGATTENPSFHLVTPLLSRCRVLKLNPLDSSDIARLLRRAAADPDRGLARSVGPHAPALDVDDGVFEFLSLHCDGDARVALNALEIAAVTASARVAQLRLNKDEKMVGGNAETSSSASIAEKKWGEELKNSRENKENGAALAAIDDAERTDSARIAEQKSITEDKNLEGIEDDGLASVIIIGVGTTSESGRIAEQKQSKEVKNAGDDGGIAIVSIEDAKEALQCKHIAYDRAGEEHYNLISALHKSMRGSDANAAMYWLARMLEGGENPLYIARRLVRFASEDVGLADPAALSQAVACYQACHFLGMPECNVNLAQCVAYLALAPKSVAVYRAFEAAQRVVKESGGGNEGVPLHLRNAPTKLMKDMGYGKGYIYTPDDPNASQTFLPPSLKGYKFFDWPPSSSGS